MEISLETIQSLAPDQASLAAAKKLLSPGKWPQRGKTEQVNTLWGQCQGSGSTPYYVIADVCDHGYKCTCPSRKFPCKHILALWWQFAEQPAQFNEAPAPDWVQDWLGRRRKTASTGETPKPPTPKDSNKDIHSADLAPEPVESAADVEAKAKRAAAAKQATLLGIGEALEDFALWMEDQLRTGISEFVKHAQPRCRQIAARLVDAKAGNLASRLDELPAKMLQQKAEQQANWAMLQLGQLVSLAQAFKTHPEDADTWRAIATTESRDNLLQRPQLLRDRGLWLTLGDSSQTRRDGLVQHNRWLLKVAEHPRFALLQDYYPASAGRRDKPDQLGTVLEGELAFYPSRWPLRALLLEHRVLPTGTATAWPVPALSINTQYAQALRQLPWIEEVPCLLGPGHIAQDNTQNSRQAFWWLGNGQAPVAITNRQLPPLLRAGELHNGFALHNGQGIELHCVFSATWGLLEC